jgi:lipoate-protein ligase A
MHLVPRRLIVSSLLSMPAIKPDCRLLADAPGSGAWNMALDEVLLDSAVRDGILSLRFYRWSEPTLSLGYFQHYADRAQHTESLACPAVRRSSGGGAILHDQELTYSLAVPAELSMARNPVSLYDAAHDSLVDALASWGIHADKHTCDDAMSALPPFLCFERRACGDVLIDRYKVCGSAQRRHKGAILQHGSVLLRTSASAKQLPGVRELTDVTLHENELLAAWYGRLSNRLRIRTIPGELTPAEIAATRGLTLSKHSTACWIQKR